MPRGEYGNRARKEILKTQTSTTSTRTVINFATIRKKLYKEIRLLSEEQESEQPKQTKTQWIQDASNLFCYTMRSIYYNTILHNIRVFCKQYREFKDKKIREEFEYLNYYEKRDVLANKLPFEMLQSVLFTIGFSKSDEIIENILKRMDEMEIIEDFYDMENPKRRKNSKLSKMYECAVPIHDIARDLRIIGIEYGFTIVSTQLSIVLGMFLEFIILQFIEEINKQNVSKKRIMFTDVIKAKDILFSGFDIPFNEDVYAQCLTEIPPVKIVEKINSFPIPPLRNKRR